MMRKSKAFQALGIVLPLAAVPSVLVLIRILFLSTVTYLKVGWSEGSSLYYLMRSSFLIFVLYTAIVIVVIAVYRRFQKDRLSRLALLVSMSVLVIVLSLVAVGYIGLIPLASPS